MKFNAKDAVTVVGICAVQMPTGEVLHAATSDGRVYSLEVDGDISRWNEIAPVPGTPADADEALVAKNDEQPE
jgi:hypothetical protein